jgi:hypothetical protein
MPFSATALPAGQTSGPAGGGDPDRDLTPIGDQYLVHGISDFVDRFSFQVSYTTAPPPAVAFISRTETHDELDDR